MKEIFKLFPAWLLTPSYRTFSGIGVIIFGMLIAYLYMIIATIVGALVGIREQKKTLKKD